MVKQILNDSKKICSVKADISYNRDDFKSTQEERIQRCCNFC